MNLLAIDASTDCMSVALAIKGIVLCQEQAVLRQHANRLLPTIERLLIEADCDLGQLDAIVYGQGPGSFTGLRIACSVAKGLAYAHDLPLFPVSSLAAIAWKILKKEETLAEKSTILTLIDARMHQVYWACFTEAFSEAVVHVSDAKDIKVDADTSIIVAGVGYQSYLAQLPITLQAKIVEHLTCYPSAQAMISLVLSGKIKPLSAAAALPIYVRNQITQGDCRRG